MNTAKIASNIALKHLTVEPVGKMAVNWCYRGGDGHIAVGTSPNRQAAIQDAEIASKERALTFEEIEEEGDSAE